MYELTVIIPTLNEAESIRGTVNKVMEVLKKNHIFGQILVVDDNSKDDTIAIVQDLYAIYHDVDYIVRTNDPGLSQSVIHGIEVADSDVCIVMDADGQHPVEKIPELYAGICQGHDIVIGSRYMDGGEIKKWGLKRRIISLGATAIARLFFPFTTDPGSGFFAVKKKVIYGAMLHPKGYKILIEILGKGNWNSVIEIPITFGTRAAGESKLKQSTMVEYLSQLKDLFWFSLHHRDSPAFCEIERVIKFMIVGITGIVVNIGFLIFFTEFGGLYYMISSVIAIELSVISNFSLNDSWTYGDLSDSNMEYGWGSRITRFHVVSLGGMLINMAVLFVLTSGFGIWYVLSNLIGILIAFAWNFMVNRHFTWRVK